MGAYGNACCSATERQFDLRHASGDVRRYQRKGPDLTTRLLRDGVSANVPPGLVLLDVGAGIGALSFELLDRGVSAATAVDASAENLTAGREESVRLKQDHRIGWLHGDFVLIERGVPPADIVTLDRVVCCYPDFASLLGAAATHARQCLAFSYPRDAWYMRSVIAVDNALRRVRGSAFRTFVHPISAMENVVGRQGFRLVSRRSSAVWCVDIYLRAGRDQFAAGPA